MELLFYGRKEAVEVDVEEGEDIGLSGGAHRRIIFAWCSPAEVITWRGRQARRASWN
jgi:hypothetical protein